MMYSRKPADLRRPILDGRIDEIHAAVNKLTPRQFEVMVGMITGQTSKESAAVLLISHKTVEVHRIEVMRALGARTALHATRIATVAGY